MRWIPQYFLILATLVLLPALRRPGGDSPPPSAPDAPEGATTPAAAAIPPAGSARARIIATAAADVGVREATGHNDGARINRYQQNAGIDEGTAKHTGDPYCIAALYTWHLETFGEGTRFPRTGYTPTAFAGASTDTAAAQPGDCFSIYFPDLGRDAHGGLFVAWRGVLRNVAETIEANTDPSGGRDGDGVYRRSRSATALHRIRNFTD